MFNKEKEILVSLISSIFIFVTYSLIVYFNFIAPNPDIINNLKFWGIAFLILIPVTIVAQIVIHIFFFIINKIVTNEEPDGIIDERDKLIELKSIRISHWVFIIGFLISMMFLALGFPPFVMFIMLITSGSLSSIISAIAKIYLYRKGY